MSTLVQSARGTWERFPCWPPASTAAMAASSRSARSHQTRAAIRRSGEVKSEFVCKIAAALPACASPRARCGSRASRPAPPSGRRACPWGPPRTRCARSRPGSAARRRRGVPPHVRGGCAPSSPSTCSASRSPSRTSSASASGRSPEEDRPDQLRPPTPRSPCALVRPFSPVQFTSPGRISPGSTRSWRPKPSRPPSGDVAAVRQCLVARRRASDQPRRRACPPPRTRCARSGPGSAARRRRGHLPGGRHEPLVGIRGDHPHAREAPGDEGAQEVRPGPPRLRLGERDPDDLPAPLRGEPEATSSAPDLMRWSALTLT